MSLFLRNKKILFSGFLPSLSVNEIDFEKFKKAEGLFISDPWERVKSIFRSDEFGNWHPELIYAVNMAQTGLVVGGIFGGLYEAVKSANKFLYTNDTQIYANQKEAYRALNDVNILAMARGACKWAPSFAIFCGGFILISSCCELYFNKHKIINNTIAGSSIGALFKAPFGIKGMISGGIIGGALGTIYGFAFWGIYKITNTNHIEYKYAHFAYSKYKEQSKFFRKPQQNVFDDSSVLTDFNAVNVSEVKENSVQQNEKIEKEKRDI